MDYEKAYTEAVSKIKSIIADKKKQGLTNCLFEGDLNEIFPELRESEDERIRKWCISHFRECINVIKDNDEYKEYLSNKVLTWLEKQGEQKPDWNEYDKAVIDAIYNTLSHCNVTKCGVEVAEMLDWLEKLEKQGKQNSADPFLNWLEKQGKQNNIVEQLTAFAVHLNKRGAFRDDLCMDFEHEAQSFIELQKPKL